MIHRFNTIGGDFDAVHPAAKKGSRSGRHSRPWSQPPPITTETIRNLVHRSPDRIFAALQMDRKGFLDRPLGATKSIAMAFVEHFQVMLQLIPQVIRLHPSPPLSIGLHQFGPFPKVLVVTSPAPPLNIELPTKLVSAWKGQDIRV